MLGKTCLLNMVSICTGLTVKDPVAANWQKQFLSKLTFANIKFSCHSS